MVPTKRNTRPPTLKDVARAAGVSYQTVSRAINARSDISSETRERIMEIIGRLGYSPNRLAGSLRSRHTKVIGLVVSDLENSFHAEVAVGVEAEAESQGYSVILANSGEDLIRERQAVRNLVERRVDGLIIAPAEGDHSYIATEIPRAIPIVAVNRRLEYDRCGAVLLENEAAARLAVEHLVSLGNSRIGAVIASPYLMTSTERLLGFRAALKAAGLPLKTEWLGAGRSIMNPEGARAAALRILSLRERPTAFMTSSSRISEGVLLAVQELGMRHGRDVHIVGFDRTPWAALIDPPMPVIEQPTRHMGREAMRMLAGMISGSAGPTTRRFPGTLVTHAKFALEPDAEPADPVQAARSIDRPVP